MEQWKVSVCTGEGVAIDTARIKSHHEKEQTGVDDTEKVQDHRTG